MPYTLYTLKVLPFMYAGESVNKSSSAAKFQTAAIFLLSKRDEALCTDEVGGSSFVKVELKVWYLVQT